MPLNFANKKSTKYKKKKYRKIYIYIKKNRQFTNPKLLKFHY